MDLSKITKSVLAQVPKDLPPLRGIGPLGLEGEGAGEGGKMFSRAVSIVIGLMTTVAGIWFIVQIIIAGYNLVSAGGEAQKIQDAQKKITNSLIGLAVVIAAIFLLSLVGHLLHVDFLDIPGAINRLTP